MPDPKKRKPLVQKVLSGSMTTREHKDEGKFQRDFVSAGFQDEVTQGDAMRATRRAEDKALETSVGIGQFGKRTFPQAVQPGYALPVYRRNDEIQARLSRRRRSLGQPFFTDPGSGEVDFNQAPLPYVIADPHDSSNRGKNRDRAIFPAKINQQAFTGNSQDPYTSFSTTKDVANREAARKDSREIAAMKGNPVKTILSEIWRTLSKPGRHSPNRKK